MTLTRPSPADLVVDTSAIVSMVLGEPSRDRVQAALRNSRGAIISAGTLAELMVVAAGRRGPAGPDMARSILDAADVVTVPVDEVGTDAVLDAFLRFGKGRHPAGLNFGDCFAYATARHFEVPLLFIGRDFARTDLQLVDATAG